MGSKIKINPTKIKYKRNKIKSAATDIKEVDTGVTFGTYTRLNSNTQINTIYKEQVTQTDDYIVQIKSDMQILKVIADGFENIDNCAASSLHL